MDRALYSVYVHTLPNNKRYVGISYDPVKRWHNGSGYKANPYFYADIQKYGWENIKHEIIHENLSYQFAKIVEYNLIKGYGTLDREKGYNRSPSGDSSNITEETRQKMREQALGNQRSKGHYHPEERKKKISESLKKHYAPSPEHPNGLPGPNKGKTWNEETRKKMSDHMRSLPEEQLKEMGNRLPHYYGEEHPHSHAVIRIDKDGNEKRYGAIQDAVNEMGIFNQGIIRCCKGIQKEYRGYSWKYAS